MINKKKAGRFLGLIAVMLFIGLLAPYTALADDSSGTTVGALTATSVTSTSITVSSAWSGGAPSSCTLRYALHGTTNWTTFATPSGSSSPYTGTASNLSPGTAYDFEAVYTNSKNGVTGSPATLSNVSTTNGGGGGGAAGYYLLGSTAGTSNSTTSGNQSRGWLITTPTRQYMQVIKVGVRGAATGNFRMGIYDSNAQNANLLADFGQMDYTNSSHAYQEIAVPAPYSLPSNTSICIVWKNGTTNPMTGYYTSNSVSGISGGIRAFDSSDTTSAFPDPLPSRSTTSYIYDHYLAYDVVPHVSSVSPSSNLTNGQTGVVVTGGGFENRNEFSGTTSYIYLATGSTWSSKGTTVAQTITNWPNDNLGTGNQLTFTVNQGSLPSGNTVYLYVVNSSGEANATGIPVTLAVSGTPGTTTGTVSTSSVTDNSFNVAVTYTGDDDGDNSCAITVAGGTVSNLAVNRTTKTWTAGVTGLSPNTAYTISANFTDSTGNVTGTNPVTASQTTTNNGTTTGAMTATATADTSISVQATYTRDPNANNGCAIAYGTSASGPWTPLTTAKGSGLYSATASGLTAGTTYYFQATFTDADGISGTNPLTLTQATTNNGTTTGAMSATATADTSISVQATYTRDPNANNGCAIAYGTSASGPWTPLTTAKGSGLYSATASGLTAGTTYYFQATFTDADGISGTNPLTLTQATTNNGTTTGAMSATATADTSISVQATYTRDPNANNGCAIAYGTSASGPWTPLTTAKGSGLYSATASGLTAGTTYYFQATFTDGDGISGTNPLTLTQATTNNGTTTGAMSATAIATTSISVQATYTRDPNANNGCAIAYGTSASGPWTPLTTAKGSGLYSATASGLTAGTTYYFQATFTDGDGISGTNPLTLTQATAAANAFVVGTNTATANSPTQITASATYTGDVNGNSSTAFAYGTSASGPWTTSCASVTGASPRTCVISGLTAGTAYYVQVTDTDADGVTGTSPQVIGPYTTPVNALTVGTDSATVNSPTQITATAAYTGDANGNSTTAFAYGTSASGPWTASCATVTGASPRTCVISGLAAGTAYYIQVTNTDADGVTGTNPQVIGPYTTPVNALTVGANSAAVNSTTQITATATYTGDANGNSTTAFAYGLNASGPWTTSCASVTGASPRTCAISGLTAGTAYYIQVTHADADGVTGTNPQVIGPYTTLTNNLVVGTNSAVANSGTQITATASFTGDANGNSTTAFAYGTGGSGPWTTSCATVSGPSPRSCVISGLTTGNSYYIQVTQTDADGVTGANPQVIGPFVTGITCDSKVTSCTDCHSLPPSAGSHLVAEHKGDGTRNACAVCHFNYKTMTNVTSARWTTSHTNNYLDIYTSSDINGGIRGGYYSGYRNRSSLWAGGVANSNNTCSNTYCHGTTPSPIWGSTNINCTTCHDAPPTAGSHAKHNQGYIGYADNSNSSNYDFGCFKCHPQAQHAQGPATANSSAFVAFSNTSSPVALGGTYNVGTSQGNDTRGYKWSNASCSNALYCHSNGRGGNAGVTPVWGSTVTTCTSCHGGAAAFSQMTAQSAANLSRTHAKHAATDRYAFNCSQCHNGTVATGSSAISNKALHVNGIKNINISSYGNMTGYYSGSPNGSCRNVYCHSDGNGGAPNVTPQWGVTVTTCSSCHNYKAPNAMSSGQHTYHTNTPNIGSFGCVQCHSKTVDASDQIQYASGRHVNGVKDVYFNGFNGYSGGYNAATKTCSNVYCHSSGQAASTADGTPKFRAVAAWNSATTYNCKSCHGADTGTGTFVSQFGEPNYANVSTASRAEYNGHSVHVSAASDCSKCHYGTATVNVTGGFASITSGGQHINGTRDIHFRSDITGTYNATTKTCTDVSCHGGAGSGTFRWGGTGNCQSCHLASGSDVNDFVYGDGTKATISLEDWTSVGHGRKTGTYRYTGNAAAGRACTDCHSGSVSHGDAADPFRLISSATIHPTDPNTLCLSCHAQGNHDLSHVGIGTWAFTPKCVDCHDPHGDKAGNTAGEFNGAMVQQTVAYTGSNAYGVPNSTKAVDWPANFARARALPSAPYYNWSSFVVNGTYNGVCQVCHNSTVSNFNSALFTGTHNNGQSPCTNCHGHASGFKPSGKCTDCHATGGTATTQGRRDIQADFSKKSHHINASWTNISTRTCAMCHAEGNPDGSQNMTYHQSGKAVVLNVWNGAFVNGTGVTGVSRTFVRYTTGDGASGGLPVSATANLNPVCLGCHSRTNANATPFKASGDSNKPTVYDVWDNATSIGAMYSNTGTTFFSKYSPSTNNVVPQIVKAFSPHGNPTANQRGKAKYGPWVNDTVAAGSVVACMDCHNSHGSSVGSQAANTLPLTSYSSTYSGTKGGLIKEYSPANGSSTNQTTYMPTQGGSSVPYSASSALCFDCHLGDNASAPKNYKTPFGLKSTIDGYYDAGRWQATDVWTGSFAYKTAQASGNGNGGQKGGHFGASSPLTYATTHNINGRCVMCHDPHGVAQNGNRAYMVPALRDTWMTSPYKEDRVADRNGSATETTSTNIYAYDRLNAGSYALAKPARMNPRFDYDNPPYVGGGYGTGAGGNWGQGGTGQGGYFIDDNTFGTNMTYSTGYPNITDQTNSSKVTGVTANHITENDTQFAGLCLSCHTKANLQALSYSNGTDTIHVHNTVAGWFSTANAADLFKTSMAAEHLMSYSKATPRSSTSQRCSNQSSDSSAGNILPAGYRWSVTPGTTTVSNAYSNGALPATPPSTTGQSVSGFIEPNGFHRFPCSKCHTPHTSKLPRLMKTNCLDVGSSTASPAHNSAYTYPNCAVGANNVGGTKNMMMECHNLKKANTAGGGGWNAKTGW